MADRSNTIVGSFEKKNKKDLSTYCIENSVEFRGIEPQNESFFPNCERNFKEFPIVNIFKGKQSFNLANEPLFVKVLVIFLFKII